MNRRGFLAALGASPLLAKLGLAGAVPKAEPKRTALLRSDPESLYREVEAANSYLPLSPERTECSLKNESGSPITMGEVVALDSLNIDPDGRVWRVLDRNPKAHRQPGEFAVFVLALENIAPDRVGRFLVQGSGLARAPF